MAKITKGTACFRKSAIYSQEESWSAVYWDGNILFKNVLFTLLLQLTLRLKVLKRQLDEAEEEIERLENSKKKLQRELDEQQETNEQLHSQISTLKTELRSHIINTP